jgi:peptide/nickel transport system substrate-binding protein
MFVKTQKIFITWEVENSQKTRKLQQTQNFKEEESMKKWFLVPLFLLLAAVMIITSCGGEETTPATTTSPSATTTEPTTTEPTVPEPYGTITIAVTDLGTEATDPTLYESAWSWYFCNSILNYTEDGQYVGELAESWNLADDGVTWTFNLRHDVKFHNGMDFTAKDVYFTIERFISPDSTNPWAPALRDNFDSMRVVDDYTFEFKTINVEPSLIHNFCWIRSLSKEYYDEVGEEEWRAHPIGTGAWKWVELIPNISVKFEANTEYWKTEWMPEYQYLIEMEVPEEATQVAMLKRGEIDIPLGITTDRRVQLENEGWRTVVQGLSTPWSLSIIGSDLPQAGPVHDIRIRKALSYAINRQEMCDTFWQGTAVPGGGFFLIPGGYGVTDDLIAPDPYDPDQCEAWLAEAGYPDAWEDPVIQCFSMAGPTVDFFQALMGYWTKVGLQVNLNIVDAGIAMQYIFLYALEGDEECIGWIWSWAGADFNSTAYGRNMWTSYGAHQVTRDDYVDSLFDQYIVETDPDTAVAMYTEYLRAAKALYTTFGIAFVEPKLIVSPNLGAFTINPHQYYEAAMAGVKHPEE